MEIAPPALVLLLLFVTGTAASTPGATAAPPLRGLSPDPMSASAESYVNPQQRDVLSRLSTIKCIFSDLDGTLCHFDRYSLFVFAWPPHACIREIHMCTNASSA